jgi:hypothetical protein
MMNADASERELLEFENRSAIGKIVAINNYSTNKYEYEHLDSAELIDKSDVEQLSPEQTRRAAELLKAFNHDLKTHNKLIGQAKMEDLNDIAAKVKSEAETNLGTLKNSNLAVSVKNAIGRELTAADKQAAEPGVVRRFFNEGATRPEQLLKETSETLRKVVYDTMDERRSVALSVKHRAYDEVEAAMSAIGHSMRKRATTKWSNEFTPVDSVEGKIELSRAERMMLAAAAMTETSASAHSECGTL